MTILDSGLHVLFGGYPVHTKQWRRCYPMHNGDWRLTWLSRPMKKIMRKKRTDHTGAAGSWVIAFGYAINTRPGPAAWNDEQRPEHRSAATDVRDLPEKEKSYITKNITPKATLLAKETVW